MAFSSLGCSTDSLTEALRTMVTDEVFLLLLLSTLPTSFSSSPPQKDKLSSVLLADQDN